MAIMETERLIFTEFTPEDFHKLYLLLSSPVVMNYCFGPLDIEKTQIWLDSVIRSYQEHGHDYWAVWEKHTNQFIGQIGIIQQKKEDKHENYLGFMIAPRYWNKGYAAEGAAACIHYAFKSLGMNRIMAAVDPENINSIGVLTKIGMVFIQEVYAENKRTHLYSINNNG